MLSWCLRILVENLNMNNRLFLFAAVLFFRVYITPKPAEAQTPNLKEQIEQIMQQNKAIGLSVAVVKKKKIIYAESFGLKDRENNIPLTNDCIFRIASISKSFSATAIMQLVEQNKLSLRDDVSRLIGFEVRNPKYPDSVITLEMLLSHRSSLNDSQGYFVLDSINPAKTLNWRKCYNNYAPGTGYQYCNLNFNMVGTIIERVSGERFDMYVKRHILNKLGLYGGYCVDSLDAERFTTLYDYVKDSGKLVPQPGAYNPRREEIANYQFGYSTPIFSPTGGMKISATDLAKYMIMHMYLGKGKGKRVISKHSARLMQTPRSEAEGYGLAIMNTKKLISGVEMRGHTGSAWGLFSGMFFQPDKKFGFVVITNGCQTGYTDSYNNVLKMVVNRLYESFILE